MNGGNLDASMTCSRCGSRNDAGAGACGGCGAALIADVVCAACGTANPGAYRFCGECGSGLGATVSEPEVSLASSEAQSASAPTEQVPRIDVPPAGAQSAAGADFAGQVRQQDVPGGQAAAGAEFAGTAASGHIAGAIPHAPSQDFPPSVAEYADAARIGETASAVADPSATAVGAEFADPSTGASGRLRLRVALLLAAGGLLVVALMALAVTGDVRWGAAPLVLAVMSAVLAVGGLSGRAFGVFIADVGSLLGRGGTTGFNAKAQGREGAADSNAEAQRREEGRAPAGDASVAQQQPAEQFAPPSQFVAPPIETRSAQADAPPIRTPSPQPATPIVQTASPPSAPAADAPSAAGVAMPATASVGGAPSGVGASAAAQSDGGDAYYWGFLERQWGMFAAVLAGALMAYSLYRFPQGPPTTVAWICFCLAIPPALVAVFALECRCSGFVRRFRAGERALFEMRALLPWMALGAIVLFGAAVRLYNLDGFPPGLWFDEADNISQAQHIWDQNGAVFTAFTNLPTAFLVPIAVVIKLAGVSITSARLVAVMFGVAGIVAMFLLMRHMAGTLFGLIAAFLMASMRWDITWSRLGMHGITMTFCTAIAAWLTYRALRSGRMADFAVAGGAMGFGMWFYTPFRLFPIVIGIALLHALAFRRTERKRLLVNIGAMALFAVFVSLPLIQFAATHPDEFFRRQIDVSIFTHAPEGEAAGAVMDNLLRHLRMFHFEGDPNGRHNIPGAPMLDMVSGLLMVMGVAIAAFRWRSAAMFALPLWVVIMIMPGALSIPWESPQSLRSIGVIPAVAALIALAVGYIWQSGGRLNLPIARYATAAVASALLVVIAYSNISAYFGEQANDPAVYSSFSTADTLIARDSSEWINRGYNPMVSRQFKLSTTASLLGSGFYRETIGAPGNIPLSPSQVWRGAAIYLEPRESGFYDTLRAYYPDADFREVRAPSGGDALYYAAYISKEDLIAAQGIVERRTAADGTVSERIKGDTQSVWALEAGLEDTPFDVEWRGTLHVTRPGDYTLALESDSAASVILDGVELLSQDRPMVRIEPAVGLHTLEVRAQVEDGDGALRLLWQPPPMERDEGEADSENEGDIELQPLAPIPMDHLYNGDVRPIGLAGRFFEIEGGEELGDVENAVPDAMQLTASIGGAFWYDPVVDAPYLAVWDGGLAVAESGPHRFRFGNIHGDMRVLIDGEVVIDTRGDRERELELAAGERRIRLEYAHGGGSPYFELHWTQPGEGMSRVAPELLTPAWGELFRMVDGG